METKRRLTVGLLAHVDAGKTTLSEGMLYRSGALRKLGRVDHRDAFLDTDAQEKERGITIFSKQAVLSWQGAAVTLMDTPGHADFSSEMERVLSILDCAVLLISGADGIQGHTLTLWRLLKRYQVPTFLFVNKMDQPGTDKAALLSELKSRFGAECAEAESDEMLEIAAMGHEALLNRYLETGSLPDEAVARAVGARELFPCYFGSALRLEGVDALLNGLVRFTPNAKRGDAFGARVFKIARDHLGTRLSYVKITGGTLRVRDTLSGGTGESAWAEKVGQIRIYSGAKFTAVDEAEAGTVCALTGFNHTYPGEGLGAERESQQPLLTPVFTYRLFLKPGDDIHTALDQLRQLEEEDPQLHVAFENNAIHVRLMGDVQLDILKRLLKDRFHLEANFGEGAILFQETIEDTVEGIGHYEPLRHYAEVHLKLEPGERGSGLTFSSACRTDDLDMNWQRLILTHLMEKQHRGVLTGAPITDMKITLIAGRAHLKHTEGGDFRQATYRAVRQGLMQAKSVLLEPWYDMRLELPNECVGRAMADITQMGGSFEPPETVGDEAILRCCAPVRQARNYAREVTAYTRAKGRISLALRGYEPCKDQDEIVQAIGYEPERDVENTADSVFCSHGAGYVVPWREVAAHAHIQTGLTKERQTEEAATPVRSTSVYTGTLEQDKELMAIFERTYGPVKPRSFVTPPPRVHQETEKREIVLAPEAPEYLLVDGYNIIFAWDDLKQAAQQDLNHARDLLADILCNYQGFHPCRIILVFDAYKVKNNSGSVEQYKNIRIVYTKEAETADSYIEKATYELGKNNRVRVATSDGLEQLIILGNGALRLPARELRREIEQANVQISAILSANNRTHKAPLMREALQEAKNKIKS